MDPCSHGMELAVDHDMCLSSQQPPDCFSTIFAHVSSIHVPLLLEISQSEAMQFFLSIPTEGVVK